MSDRLVAFLYLLARDSLPAGEVTRLVERAERTSGEPVRYSAPELEQFARRHAATLTGG